MKPLSPREIDVCSQLLRGHNNQAIGDSLGVGLETVKYHLKNASRKLNAKGRAQVAANYIVWATVGSEVKG